MMEVENQKTMQLATVSNELPWICTLYFVLVDGSFYWLSLPERRHSREININPAVAVAVVLQPNKPVAGIQSEGKAGVVRNIEEIKRVLDCYIDKYGQGKQFVERFIRGENEHILYKLTPSRTVIFDEREPGVGAQREIVL